MRTRLLDRRRNVVMFWRRQLRATPRPLNQYLEGYYDYLRNTVMKGICQRELERRHLEIEIIGMVWLTIDFSDGFDFTIAHLGGDRHPFSPSSSAQSQDSSPLVTRVAISKESASRGPCMTIFIVDSGG